MTGDADRKEPGFQDLVAALHEYTDLLRTGASRAEIFARRPDLRSILEDELADDPGTLEAGRHHGDSAEEIRPLRRIGEFELVRELGRGGMGVVYEAEQVSVRRRVALKLMPAMAALDERALARFQRGARLCANVQHPGIAQVLVVGEDEGQHYMAMELVPGAPLSRVIKALSRRGQPPADAATLWEALDAELTGCGFAAGTTLPQRPADTFVRVVVGLFAAVADALDHVHALGVVHRDVKPANILVRRDGVPVLTDFGIAREQQEIGVTFTGELPGTAHYRAPEQHAAGPDRVDGRADVFALGVSLYETLTLVRPFSGETAANVRDQICHVSPPDPREHQPAVDRDLSAIVFRALNKDRRDRYATARALADDLRRWLEWRPVLARPMSTRLRLWRWIERNPMATAVGVAFIVLSAALATAWAQARANLRLFDLMAVVPECDALAGRLAKMPPPFPQHRESYEELRDSIRALVGQRDAVRGAATALQSSNPGAAVSFIRLAQRLDEVEARELADTQTRLACAKAQMDAEASAAWRNVLDDIAAADGTNVHAGYAQCRDLVPQHGLVPLRRNAATKLWEFWLVASGERPHLGANDRWIIGPDTGVVFVLLPAGTVADSESGKPCPVAPFFAAAHELTQGQWDRLQMTGVANPSVNLGGNGLRGDLPVQTCSPKMARALLARWGLDVPTEPQWWYLATAGDVPFWIWPEDGSDDEQLKVLEQLAEFANLSDLSAFEEKIPNRESHAFDQRVDDGHAFPAPVGSYRPNPFGLFDVIGNVREIALDGEKPWVMGGSFTASPTLCCKRTEDSMPADAGVPDIGIRVVRRMTW